MAGIQRPKDTIVVDPATGKLVLEWNAFMSSLITAINAVSQGSLVATKSFTVATVPSAADSGAGRVIYVSNETGGAVLAFSDGTNWRRVTDRNIIS